MNKLIIDLSGDIQVVAYYDVDKSSTYLVRSILVYKKGKKTDIRYYTVITGKSFLEIKNIISDWVEKELNETNKENQRVGQTEEGKIKGSLVEVLSELSGKPIEDIM